MEKVLKNFVFEPLQQILKILIDFLSHHILNPHLFIVKKKHQINLLESVIKFSKINDKSFKEFSGPIILAISCREQAKGFLIYGKNKNNNFKNQFTSSSLFNKA